MGRYIKWDDVAGRYPDMAKVGDSTSVDSAFIVPAEAELEALLGAKYTVPFDASNMTAKDLSIDIAYIKAAPNRSRNWERIKEYVDQRIKMLCDGTMVMVTTSGSVGVIQDKNTPFSTTSGSNTVFMNPTSREIHDGLDIMPTTDYL